MSVDGTNRVIPDTRIIIDDVPGKETYRKLV